MREITKQVTPDQRVIVFALAIFLCSFLGPFDTGTDLDLWDRVVFWTVAICIVGIFIEFSIVTALESPWLTRVPALGQIAIGSAIGSVPGTSFMITLNKVFRPDHLIGAYFPLFWLQVTIMAILISGLSLLINSRDRTKSEAPDEPDETPLGALKTARLIQRLPTRLREAQVISMSMQDHYVDVSTTLGNEMVLMRLSDAIDLLDGLPGVQTHRSHWVATPHAKSLARKKRRYELALSDGRSVPVSTSYKAAVEQMLNEKGQA